MINTENFHEKYEENLLEYRRPLTYVSIIIYTLFFFYIYAQLWLVLKYKYKLWCHRTYVLFVSIAWCVLRITLFLFYAVMEQRASTDPSEQGPPLVSQRVGYVAYFLLFSFPLYLQFTALCLMVAYFYQVHMCTGNNFVPGELGVWRWPSLALVTLNIVVLCVNLASAVIIKAAQLHESGPDSLAVLVVVVVHVRVLTNALCFLLLVASLARLTRDVAGAGDQRVLLDLEDLTERSVAVVCVVLVFVYLCRTVINVLALIPAVGFVLDTDQVDLLSDSHSAYLMFCVVLVLWEFLPTLLVVVFFRAKPPRDLLPYGALLSYTEPFDEEVEASRTPTSPQQNYSYEVLPPYDTRTSPEQDPATVHCPSQRFLHRTSLFTARLHDRQTTLVR